MSHDLRPLEIGVWKQGVYSMHDGLDRTEMKLEIAVFLYAYAE
jgi:hypothetical protein